MKKTLLCAGLMAIGFANAQTGKVGINTENPNETLEINGTLRVDNMPLSGEGKIYDGAETTETTFTANSVMATDDQGNVGKMAFPFGELLLHGGDDGKKDAFETKRFGYTGSNSANRIEKITAEDVRKSTPHRNFNAVLADRKFSLAKRSLVIVNVSASFSAQGVGEWDGNSFITGTNASPKRMGVRVVLNGNVITDPNATADLKKRAVDGFYFDNKKIDGGTDIINNGIPFTVGEMLSWSDTNEEGKLVTSTGSLAGVYAVQGSSSQILEAGEHSVQVEGRFTFHYADPSGIDVSMGNSSADVLDVIAIPLEL